MTLRTAAAGERRTTKRTRHLGERAGNAEQPRLAPAPAHDLDADRETVRILRARQHDRGMTGVVEKRAVRAHQPVRFVSAVNLERRPGPAVRTPAVANASLSVKGTPWSGPHNFFCARALSASFARLRARAPRPCSRRR